MIIEKRLILVYNVLAMQAWFNGRTSASQADDAGSIPVACFNQEKALNHVVKLQLNASYNNLECPKQPFR